MNEEQTKTLLKLISGIWPNFQVTPARVDAWLVAFADEDPIECLAFFRTAIKSGVFNSDFAPTPIQFIRQMREMRRPALSPLVKFEAGPSIETEQLAKAWRIWGGQTRWNALPDAKYCDNPEHALQTWRFEAMRFAEIYNSLEAEDERAERRLTHTEAKNALRNLSGTVSGVAKLLRA